MYYIRHILDMIYLYIMAIIEKVMEPYYYAREQYEYVLGVYDGARMRLAEYESINRRNVSIAGTVVAVTVVGIGLYRYLKR